jgi:HEPN domain-containing protein
VTSADVEYRLRIAQGFLDESRQDVALNRWRSAVDNAQLAVENAAKAVLALIAPIGRTHNPAPLLRQHSTKADSMWLNKVQCGGWLNVLSFWASTFTCRPTTATNSRA